MVFVRVLCGVRLRCASSSGASRRDQMLEACRPTRFGSDLMKEHAVPPCLVLVIDDNLYGLMVALSYI